MSPPSDLRTDAPVSLRSAGLPFLSENFTPAQRERQVVCSGRRLECDRCGKDRMINEAHAPDRQRDMPIRVLLARARHEGCGGGAGKVELLTGIDGVSSRPVRRIVLRGG
jgi:hypothetical protein